MKYTYNMYTVHLTENVLYLYLYTVSEVYVFKLSRHSVYILHKRDGVCLLPTAVHI